jgi:hypothetical protein
MVSKARVKIFTTQLLPTTGRSGRKFQGSYYNEGLVDPKGAFARPKVARRTNRQAKPDGSLWPTNHHLLFRQITLHLFLRIGLDIIPYPDGIEAFKHSSCVEIFVLINNLNNS